VTDESFDPFAGPDDDDLMSQMDAQEEAVAWIPKDEGETIIGKVVSVGTVTSSFQPDQEIPRVLLLKDDGTYASLTGYHTVLRLRLEEAAPKVGDRLAAKFFGEKNNNAGTRTFKSYGVKVRRADGGNGSGVTADPKAPPPAPIDRESEKAPF
jgi:hypothetical protein